MQEGRETHAIADFGRRIEQRWPYYFFRRRPEDAEGWRDTRLKAYYKEDTEGWRDTRLKAYYSKGTDQRAVRKGQSPSVSELRGPLPKGARGAQGRGGPLFRKCPPKLRAQSFSLKRFMGKG